MKNVCCSGESSDAFPSAALMPPSAAPEWLRVGCSLETTATSAPYREASMAARIPATPAPTTTTSCRTIAEAAYQSTSRGHFVTAMCGVGSGQKCGKLVYGRTRRAASCDSGRMAWRRWRLHCRPPGRCCRTRRRRSCTRWPRRCRMLARRATAPSTSRRACSRGRRARRSSSPTTPTSYPHQAIDRDEWERMSARQDAYIAEAEMIQVDGFIGERSRAPRPDPALRRSGVREHRRHAGRPLLPRRRRRTSSPSWSSCTRPASRPRATPTTA